MKQTRPQKIFQVFNVLFLALLAFICLLPILNLLAVSFSSRNMVQANLVKLWPKQFTVSSYHYMLNEPMFFDALLVTIKRVGLGWTLNLLLTILAAYPLSKSVQMFRSRKIYVAYFIVTMVFSGGMIPTYLVVSQTGLIDTIWALVLPEAVDMFYVLLLMNFFRGIPSEIEEAALMDSANSFQVLLHIYLPLSLPSLATITLYVLVHHWNIYMDGMLYMNNYHNYPLMTYLRSVIMNFNALDIRPDEIAADPILAQLTGRSTKAAAIILCTVPLLIIYPFLQKFFVSGMVMGSVKG